MEYQLLSIPGLISFLFFIFLIIKIGKLSKSGHSTTKLPPGPKKLPIIGNIHQLVGSAPHNLLAELAKKYGAVMYLQLGEVPHVIISSPEAAKEMLKTHDAIFAQRPFLLAPSALTYNLKGLIFAPYGEYWRQLRQICVSELLSAKRVQSFRSMREEEVTHLIKHISSTAGLPFNFSRKLFSLTYDIVALASFGKKCKDQEEFLPFVEEFVRLAGGFNLADFFPSKKFLRMIGGIESRLKSLSKESDKMLESIIKDHRAGRETTDKNRDGKEESLVDVLLKLQENGNLDFHLADENIKAMLLDIFVAGSETSATVTEWAMSEMLKNPRVLEKAQEEVWKVFGKNGNVDESALHELQYLKLIIKETLRLHPPASLLVPRESREKCEINGYKIPAQSKVLVNAWAMGRDPKYWADAETFCPERFFDSPIDYKGNNFELIPFGAGRRMCPGVLFGIADIELPLAQFLYHFDWKLPNGQKPEALDMTESFGATVRRKNDLMLIAIPYNSLPVEVQA